MSDLVTRVCAVMADIGAIAKDKTNTFHHYGYVSAEALRAKVQKACAKHLLILRLTFDHEDVSPTSSMMKCTCAVSVDGTTWVVLGEGWGAGIDKTEKSPMKANTAAAKYALANSFCIPLGEDPEADAETDASALRMGERLANPGVAYGPEEQARSDKQADVTRGITDGFIGLATTATHVDDIMKLLDEHIDVIDTMGTREIARFGKAVIAHCDTGAVEGMTASGFREAFTAATSASRKARKHGKG